MKTSTLAPGQQLELSRSNGYRVFAERSCDGKTLRIVRESKDGFEVIQSRRY